MKHFFTIFLILLLLLTLISVFGGSIRFQENMTDNESTVETTQYNEEDPALYNEEGDGEEEGGDEEVMADEMGMPNETENFVDGEEDDLDDDDYDVEAEDTLDQVDNDNEEEEDAQKVQPFEPASSLTSKYAKVN